MSDVPPPPPNDRLPLSRGQRILRIIGGVAITGCAVMVVLGLTLLKDDLAGPRFAVYWSWCFLLAVAAMFLALWDMILVRRAFKQRRRELFREEFMTEEFITKISDAIRKDEEK